MKNKISILFAFALFGAIAFTSNQNVSAAKCDEQISGYKKKFLVSGCKQKHTEICVIRCAQPNVPTISI
jgi:hypothetical protein